MGPQAALLGYGPQGGLERGRLFALGTAGAGYGATTYDLKGGLGSASAVTSSGFRVGALVAVNSVGRATRGESLHFWAAPYERQAEFGGLGFGPQEIDDHLTLRLKSDTPSSTDLAVVVTDAALTTTQVKRVAIMAQDGYALALRPAHAPMDNDVVFAAATAGASVVPDLRDLTEIGMLAAECVARAVARGVYEASPLATAGRKADVATTAGDEFSDRMSVCFGLRDWRVAGRPARAQERAPILSRASSSRLSGPAAAARASAAPVSSLTPNLSGPKVLLDHPGRVADDDATGGNVTHDNRARGDDAAVADIDPGIDDRGHADMAALANPGVHVLEMDRIMGPDVGAGRYFGMGPDMDAAGICLVERGHQRLPRKHHEPEEIVAKLRQVDVLTSQGRSVADSIRAIGVTEVTYYRWRQEYGGLKSDQVRRMKDLEAENTRLRRAVSDQTLDKMILAEAARGNF